MEIEFYKLADLPAWASDAWERDIRERYGGVPLTQGFEWLRLITRNRPDDAVVVVASEPADQGAQNWVLPLLFTNQSLPLRLGPLTLGRLRLPLAKVYGGDCGGSFLEKNRVSGVAEAILSRYPALQGLLMDHVPQGVRVAGLKQGAVRAGLMVRTLFEGLPHYRLILPPDAGAFRALRSGDSLKKIRKHERQLAEQAGGPCQVVEFRSALDWAPCRGAIDQLVASSWQARYLRHTLDWDELGRLAESGWVRLFLLASGARFVAYVVCYQGQDYLIREQSGYDPAFARYYPGELLMHRMVERLYQGVPPAVVDFGVGEGYHKRMHANDVVQVDGVLLLRPTLVNRFKWGAYSACRTADRVMRTVADRLAVKQRLTRYFKRVGVPPETPHPSSLLKNSSYPL